MSSMITSGRVVRKYVECLRDRPGFRHHLASAALQMIAYVVARDSRAVCNSTRTAISVSSRTSAAPAQSPRRSQRRPVDYLARAGPRNVSFEPTLLPDSLTDRPRPIRGQFIEYLGSVQSARQYHCMLQSSLHARDLLHRSDITREPYEIFTRRLAARFARREKKQRRSLDGSAADVDHVSK